VIWRDTTLLARHDRAADGAHRRVVTPEHFAPLFGPKPRAQVMLYRQALLDHLHRNLQTGINRRARPRD